MNLVILLQRVSSGFKSVNLVRNQFFVTSTSLKTTAKPALRFSEKKISSISPIGWFLLVIPATTFSLGVWQMQRKKWKESLLADLQACTDCDPVALPESFEEIKKLEYKPVYVRGRFLHDKEMFMGPRTLLVKGDASTQSSLVGTSIGQSQGYLVVTPLKLDNRDETILVNRGWVPIKKKNSETRQKGQVDGSVDVIGVVRLQEHRPNFSLKNREGSNNYFYRDLKTMAESVGAAPIFIDATTDFQLADGPVGGQTRISLRNEHMSYILTWFSLSGATSYMWYKRFLK